MKKRSVGVSQSWSNTKSNPPVTSAEVFALLSYPHILETVSSAAKLWVKILATRRQVSSVSQGHSLQGTLFAALRWKTRFLTIKAVPVSGQQKLKQIRENLFERACLIFEDLFFTCTRVSLEIHIYYP